MSQEPEFVLPDFGCLTRGRFSYLPVAPGRLEFALEVRKRVLTDRPGVVVVELPGWLERVYQRAIQRLPQITVLVYPDDNDEDRGIYIPVEPADPFTEAVRSAKEIGAQVVFAEPDVGERPHLPDFYPDPYALRSIGVEKYTELYRFHPIERTDEIRTHAGGIAWKLQGTDPEAQVLVVVSLNLFDPVLDAMEEPQEPPPRRRAPSPRRHAESTPGLPGGNRRGVSVSAGALRAIPDGCVRGHAHRPATCAIGAFP